MISFDFRFNFRFDFRFHFHICTPPGPCAQKEPRVPVDEEKVRVAAPELAEEDFVLRTTAALENILGRNVYFTDREEYTFCIMMQ